MAITTVYVAVTLLMSRMLSISLCYKQRKLFCFKFASLESLHKCQLLSEATPGLSKNHTPAALILFPPLCLIFFWGTSHFPVH